MGGAQITITPMIGSNGSRMMLVESTTEGQRVLSGQQLRDLAKPLRWRLGIIDQSVASILEVAANHCDGGWLPCV